MTPSLDRRAMPRAAPIAAADLPAGDAKARAAFDRYSLAEIASCDDPAFDDAYGLLDAEFGPRRELERRLVVARWLDERDAPRRPAELPSRYHLIVARDRNGRIAGVRDCHVVVDPKAAVVVVYLAHTLVLGEHRRTGLATLLRTAPLTLGRRAASELSAASGGEPRGARPDLLLAAEMEPVVADEPATVVRLIAYGRAGFRAVAPRHLPYCQPDFRDFEAQPPPPDFPHPLPLLAVVRWVDHEAASALPLRLVRAFVVHLYAVFATHCREADLAGPRKRALEAVREAGGPVPLLTLPTAADDVAALTALTRDEMLRTHAEPPLGPNGQARGARGGMAG